MYLDRVVNIERVIKAIRPIIREFANHLLKTARFNDRDPDSDKAYSIEIPWSRRDDESAEEYARKMAALTGRETARAPVSLPILLASKTDAAAVDAALPADEKLKWYLDNWGDRGPYGSGRH